MRLVRRLITLLSLKSNNQRISYALFFATIRSAVILIPTKSRKRFSLVILSQISLGLLDLVGVGLIGAIGALAIRGIQSQGPGDRVSYLLGLLNLEELRLESNKLTKLPKFNEIIN